MCVWRWPRVIAVGQAPGGSSPRSGCFPQGGMGNPEQEGIEEEQADELCSGALAGWGLGPCWWWRLVEELPEPPAEVRAGEARRGADLSTSVDVWTQHVGVRKERHPSGISILGVCSGPRATFGLFTAAVPFRLVGPPIPFNRGSGGDGHVGGIFMTWAPAGGSSEAACCLPPWPEPAHSREKLPLSLHLTCPCLQGGKSLLQPSPWWRVRRGVLFRALWVLALRVRGAL